MIEAIDLTKRYEDGLLALDHLNLRVEKGVIYCLLGANGAGKTTTINLFLNFIEPTAGTQPRSTASTSPRTRWRPRSSSPTSARTSCSTAISRRVRTSTSSPSWAAAAT